MDFNTEMCDSFLEFGAKSESDYLRRLYSAGYSLRATAAEPECGRTFGKGRKFSRSRRNVRGTSLHTAVMGLDPTSCDIAFEWK